MTLYEIVTLFGPFAAILAATGAGYAIAVRKTAYRYFPAPRGRRASDRHNGGTGLGEG